MPADPEPRHSKAGLDRRGLLQVVIGFAIVFGGIALLLAADVVGLERRLTTATVVELIDRSHKHGHECRTVLTTGYGYANIFKADFCRFSSWRLGDKAEVMARQLRFTRTIVLSTRNTIFDGAYTMLPES